MKGRNSIPNGPRKEVSSPVPRYSSFLAPISMVVKNTAAKMEAKMPFLVVEKVTDPSSL